MRPAADEILPPVPLLAMDFLQVKFKNYYLFIADDRDIR